MADRDNVCDIIAPKVLIVPVQTPLPIPVGASSIGMLGLSGGVLYFISGAAMRWERITSWA